MFQKLVSHNLDLQKLVKKGYAVAFDTNHLIIRDIPYIGSEGELRQGSIVAQLVFINQERVHQSDHQIFFAGSVPHGLNGAPISNLGGGSANVSLSESSADVVVERSFSNKPKTGSYVDFFDKIETYVAIISGPAIEKFQASPYTNRLVEDMTPDTIFKFRDTLTSKAEIGDIAAKMENEIVAVIGLGGTGAYVLDFLVKSRVREIRGFDADQFQVHNAYRAPGKTIESEFGRSKAEVMQSRYKNFRTGLSLQDKFLDESSAEELVGVTFAFVCVDKGSSRKNIFDLLISLGIPFIDAGMGLDRRDATGPLKGTVRLVYFPSDNATEILEKGLADLADVDDGIYRSNIQISELNALNASLAIIKYKQLRGFYADDIAAYHTLFNISEMKTYGDTLE